MLLGEQVVVDRGGRAGAEDVIASGHPEHAPKAAANLEVLEERLRRFAAGDRAG